MLFILLFIVAIVIFFAWPLAVLYILNSWMGLAVPITGWSYLGAMLLFSSLRFNLSKHDA